MKIDAQFADRIVEGEDLDTVLQEILDGGDEDYLDNLLPLCKIGGWPNKEEDPCIEGISEAVLNGTTVTFKAEVYFDEKVYGGGCPDMPTIEARTGEVRYKIDLLTLDMTAMKEEQTKQQYDSIYD